MTLAAKLGFGALALGSVGGLGYVGTRYFNNDESDKVVVQQKTIKELIDEKYTHILLNTETTSDNTDASGWTANWDKYKLENKTKNKGEDALQLPSWTAQIGDGVDLISELKTKCASLKTSTNGSSYEDVTKYCAREVTIKDQADKEQLAIISQQTRENNSWNAVAGKHTTLKSHFTNLKIAEASTGAGIKGTDVKKGCEAALNKNKSESDYQTTYDSYKEVCVEK